MGKDATNRLLDKAAARTAIPMTGHSNTAVVEKRAAGLLQTLFSKGLKYAPMVDEAVGGLAQRGSALYGKAFRAKPKTTLFGTGLGLGAANDAVNAATGLGLGKWDPAAHAEKIDPRVSGWSAAGHAYTNPLQTLLALTGNAGKKAPLTVGRPIAGSATKPTNVRLGPDGKPIGTQIHDVDLELSPRYQAALDAQRAGTDHNSVLRGGMAESGMSDGGLLSDGMGQPPAAHRPTSRPYYADPKFIANSSAASPDLASFSRSF